MWGVACSPVNHYFATIGADKRVRIFSPSSQVAISAPFPYELFSIDWSADGQLIVVGDQNGTLYVLNAMKNNPLKVLSENKNSNISIQQNFRVFLQSLKISPDCERVAYAIAEDGDCKVHIY